MLSILIVNWNTRDYLRACLFSLRSACASIEHEVIVVDNDSHDDSAVMVRTEFPEVKLVASSSNLGFAAGNNKAYEMSSGEFIWLLNPDTEVLDNTPQLMLDFLSAGEKRGAVASALLNTSDRKPQQSCRKFPTPAALWAEALGLARRFPRSHRYGFYRMGWWRYNDTREVEQPMASSFMLKRAVIESIGGLFDEQFPIFFNDVDLCWRLRSYGWQIWYLPHAQVLHHGGASTRQAKPAMIATSHDALTRFYAKHYRSQLSLPTYCATMALIKVAGAWRHWRAFRNSEASSASSLTSCQ